MKKIKITAGIIILILLTCMLSVNNEKMYVKKKHFNSSTEVLQELSTNKLMIQKNGDWQYINSDVFNECLSKRKRLTDSDFYGISLEIKDNIKLSDKEKEKIKNDYKKLLKNYKNVDMKITKIEPVKLKVRIYNENYYSNAPGLKDEDKYNDELLTLVFIDEGEGMVIDYFYEEDINNNIYGEQS